MSRVVSILLTSIATWFRSRLSLQLELIPLRRAPNIFPLARYTRHVGRYHGLIGAGAGRKSAFVMLIRPADLWPYGQNIGTHYFPDTYGLIHSFSTA